MSQRTSEPSRSAGPPAAEVDGSRYEIEHKLGEGGTGAVYLARDRETGERVALKKLFRMDGKSVLRLKREFRSLVDVAHPNLVKLFDMGRASDSWFLTMEYLDGIDLSAYLTPSSDPGEQRRMLGALQQLARAIVALHQRGMLHRDLKPSNVMVVGERVVVLDFGLVRELTDEAPTVTEDGAMPGTPAYMAPEQMGVAELSTAADWYAFGVIVYEAISGVLPIDGTLLEILRLKLENDPVPLRELAPEAPQWLCDLCMALLRRDPSARPNGEAVIAAFERALAGGARDVPRTQTENLLPTENEARSAPFLGRRSELQTLGQALKETERGQTVVVHVRGLSGTGKSALVEHFLDELDELGRGPLLLRSRCYELEQMPFKALDGVLDALVRHLAHLDDLAVAQVLPHEIAALSQVFPVLERLPAVKRLLAGAKPVRDAMNDRQRAELALRQLLDRLAGRQPIVVWVDDLQWGDLDSARILRGWMKRPMQAPLLFVLSYRSDEVATSSCLASLLQPEADGGEQPAPEFGLDIAPLDHANIRALCEQRLGSLSGAGPELVARIVQEADGSPFLASQLTALAEAKLARGDSDLAGLSIDALVAQTGTLLPDDAKTLLAVLAVAGRPMPPKLLFHAARVRQNGRTLVHTLRGLNLVRTRDIGGERALEVYHDRVREGVQARLSESERISIHAALLEALEFSGKAEPDWLLTLALGAGRKSEALQFARAAAERANTTLAFERAAELYQCCLELSPDGGSAELYRKLALARVRCGSGVKAADAYLETAKRVSPQEGMRCMQLAATHLLRNGHFAQGERLVHDLLERMDAPLPQSEAGLLAAIVWERTRLKMRGMKLGARADASELLAKCDAFHAFGVGLQQYDTARAALLNMRALSCALDAGEPMRIVLGLAVAAMSVAGSGAVDARQECDALLQRAEALSANLPPRARAELCGARAVCAFYLSRVRFVLEPALETERILRSVPSEDAFGDYHLRYTVATARICARHELGELREARAELQDLLREAYATDNRLLLTNLTAIRTYLTISEGRAALAAERLDQAAREFPVDRFGVAHAAHLIVVMHTACTTGDYAWAHRYLEPAWKRWMNSPIRHSGIVAIGVHGARARMFLNEYAGRALPSDVLRMVKQDNKVLQHSSLGSAVVKRTEARLAYAAGELQRAAALFLASAETYDAEGMLMHEARSRFALGAVLGGDEGRAMKNAALERLRGFGLVDPLGDVRAFTPELT